MINTNNALQRHLDPNHVTIITIESPYPFSALILHLLDYIFATKISLFSFV